LINNPGKYSEFSNLSGKDKPVIEYLEKMPETKKFITNILGIVDNAVNRYNEMNYSDLMISFGCTGGQHRSVYFAEQLKKYLNTAYPQVETEIIHTEL